MPRRADDDEPARGLSDREAHRMEDQRRARQLRAQRRGADRTGTGQRSDDRGPTPVIPDSVPDHLRDVHEWALKSARDRRAARSADGRHLTVEQEKCE